METYITHYHLKITYLQGQFSRRCENNRLKFAHAELTLSSQVLYHGEAEGEGLAGACEVSRNHVLAVVDRVEAVLLNGEEALIALGAKFVGSAGCDFGEALEARILGY